MNKLEYNKQYSLSEDFQSRVGLQYELIKSHVVGEIWLVLHLSIVNGEDPSAEFTVDLKRGYILNSLATCIVNTWFESDIVNQLKADKEFMDNLTIKTNGNHSIYLFAIRQALSRLLFTIQHMDLQSI